MNDLLEYINSYINRKIFKILENSFDKNKPFLDALLSRRPLILLYKPELLNYEDNYFIKILKQFG